MGVLKRLARRGLDSHEMFFMITLQLVALGVSAGHGTAGRWILVKSWEQDLHLVCTVVV